LSVCQSHNSPRFNLSIFRYSGILGAADEAVLNMALTNTNKHAFEQSLWKRGVWRWEV
jgi:hypothetical protein